MAGKKLTKQRSSIRTITVITSNDNDKAVYRVWDCPLGTCAGLTAVLGNAIILMALMSNRHISRKPGIDAIVPMSISDLITGIGCFVGGSYRLMFVLGWVKIPPGAVILVIWTPLTAGTLNSLLLAVAIAVDRLWSINRPFSYIKSNHNLVVKRWAAAATSLSAVVQVAVFIGPNLSAAAKEFSPVGVWMPWYSAFYPGFLIAISVVLAILFVMVIVTYYSAGRRAERLYASRTLMRFRLAEQRHIRLQFRTL